MIALANRPATHRLTRHLLAVAATAALVLSVAACGGAASTTESNPGAVTGGGPDVMAPVPATGVAQDGSTTSKDNFSAPDGTVTGGSGSGGQAVSPADATSIIKTGSMSVEVEDLAKSVDAANQAIKGLGGYVSATAESNYGPEKTFAQITYRVPAARWDDALAAIKGLAKKVTDEQTGTVEITGQILDLDARLRNLRASETALLGIMEKATKVTDILEVQKQLTDVRGQIEQLTTEKRHLSDQAAMSTLSVAFTVPVAAVVETQQGWDVTKTIDQAAASLVGLAQFAVSAAIWAVIVLLPALIVLGILLLVLRFLARLVGRVLAGPFNKFFPPRAPKAEGGPTEKPAA